VKRFPILKLSSVVVMSLIIMTFVSCKTTKMVDKNVVPESANEKIDMIDKVTPPVTSSETDKIVLDKEMEYPYGIMPIVKNDNGDNLFDLIIVHTNDVNSNIYSTEDSIGYARLSTMIKEGKKVSDNILVLDAGNNSDSIPLVKLGNDSFTSDLLNHVGYDAIALNQEDYMNGVNGKDNYGFKLLSSNVLDSNKDMLFQPYQIYDFNNFKISVIGVSAPFENDGSSYMSDMVVENAQNTIDMVHQYSDFVVVVGNMKDSQISGISAKEICENLNGIDLFIDGESPIISGSKINGTTIVSAKANMASVGVVDLLIKNNEVVSMTPFEITANDVNNPKYSDLAKQYNISSIPEDSEIVSYIKSNEESISSQLNKIVATIDKKLSVTDIGKKATNYSKLLCVATTSMNDVDATLLPANTFKTSLESGALTYEDVLKSLIPNDSIVVKSLSGADIYAILEDGYSNIPDDYLYYLLTDFKIIYNRFGKQGNRVLRVKLNNKNIDKDAIYKIATTEDYANNHGYKIIGKAIPTNNNLSDILIDYLNK
jgi:2',3'-cyclic-nucleotide 2'-phosphodiesterase (5'-nucleotidase family)